MSGEERGAAEVYDRRPEDQEGRHFAERLPPGSQQK